MGRTAGKKWLFRLIIVVINLAALEGAAFVVLHVMPTLHNQNWDRLDRLSDFPAYRKFVTGPTFDAVTGWKPTPNSRTREMNCLGEPTHYTVDADGARRTLYPGAAKIILAGDSFTFGAEVKDEETYPNRLATKLKMPVKNYAVGGYGSLQAVLRFEKKAVRHPQAKIAVLGIMYENIKRIRNGYRPAYHSRTGIIFGFKPKVEIHGRAARIAPNINAVPVHTPKALRARVRKAFAADYWTPPDIGFPYLWSLISRIGRAPVDVELQEKIDEAIGRPQYGNYFRNEAFRTAMTHVIDRFVAISRDHGLRPFVFFIPRNSTDRSSPDGFIRTLNDRMDEPFIFNVGRAKGDWQRYNLKPDGCHPSPYGQHMIASFVAGKLGKALTGLAEPAVEE